jgi:large repetitive protein
MKQNICSALTTRLFKLVVAALVLLFHMGSALAAPCDLKSPRPPIIQHNLASSYCELCSYGYVTIIVTTPFDGADMTSMTVVENLRTSGLTYDPAAPTPIRYSVNGGALQVGGAPTISGANGSVLTWTSAQIPALSLLTSSTNDSVFRTIAITYAVRRAAALSREALASPATNRQIQASLSYSTNPVCTITSPVSTGLDLLPLREPIPSIQKAGRNVDAGQTSYTSPLYGTNNDDVIWRVRLRNTGLAAMQDMRFDDLMQSGSMLIKYACPTEAAALAVANNNGVAPGGSTCVVSSNTISNSVVNGLFSNPDNTIVDVPAGGTTDIYLAGKINNDGACTANRTNTVSDVQWGCDGEGLAGGIAATSTGATPGTVSATLSTFAVVNTANLSVVPVLTGVNTAQPVGSKGLMTISIRNNTGGAVRNIKLRDVLPLEYVMDSTFTPTFQMFHPGGYGNYAGMVNAITWTNPAAGTVPLTTTNPLLPLANTQPEFSLLSIAPHPVAVVNANDATQFNMLRHGDRVVITFRVVLIKSASYDKVADLDVHTESPADGTDPNNQTTTLTNSLFVTYEDFCALGTTKNLFSPSLNQTFNAFPEDLDIDINGTVFIVTNDPLQPVTLPVVVRNNGGHDARDYHVFVSFGATMEVTSAPAGCSVIAHATAPTYQPLPWRVWVLPASIPSSATVYNCTPGGILPNPLAPGASRTLNFTVIKTSDPARIAVDDLSFRADVVGEIMLSNLPPSPSGQALWFPVPTARADLQTDRANNYSLDAIRARVIGFNLAKSQVGTCTENNPPPASPDNLVQIGEECTFHIDTGGWFGFQTPGFTYIAVQNVTVTDQIPNGQGYISSTDPLLSSTSQIKTPVLTAQTSPPLNTLDEGWIDWRFNQVGALSNRILQKDEWFRVNITDRILNDPVNLSGLPNQHAAISSNVLNSTFEAVFNNATTGLDEIFLLGPGTVGYPQAPARTFNLTVTEPNLTVAKSVCNERKYGTGTACSNFVALASDGDSFDTYIYRITVSNGATASGVARAPAYDLNVTDVLDPSDLAYVVPFGSDGLDNDGDGLTDAADLNGEGTITDNIVKNAIPATIAFSQTHSNPLLKLNPGASVTFYYRVNPDQDVQPAQQLVNTVTTSYDSLAGASGAQTVVQPANGTIGGARVYNTTPTTATVQMIQPSTQPKKILQLSQLPIHAVPVTPPAGQPVSVGEEIKYELHTLLPIANLRNFVITDNLPAGVRCAEAPPVNLNAPPYSAAGFVPGGIITPTCTATQVQWNFGTQALTIGSGVAPYTYDFAINFIGRVENSAGTNNGGLIRNGGAFTVANAQYTNSSNTVVTLPYANVDIQVQEPTIALTKAFSLATADASDLITVTVTASNTGTATAYNLRVLDDLALAAHLSYFGTVSGTDPPDVVDVTLGANRPVFIWNSANPKYAIAPGATRTFTYKVRVEIGAQPLEVISNNALNRMQAKWDSLPGSNTALNTTGFIGADGSATGLRNGTLPNAGSTLNDYETSASATFSVPAITLSKTDLTPAVVPAVGAYKNFQVDINLPEGSSQNVLLTDNLSFGGLSYLLANNATYDITYTFQGIVSINGVAPGEAAFTAFPADNTTGNAVWNIGTVVTASEDDTATSLITPRIRINYSARIDNTATTNAGNTLRNSAVVTYRNGSTGATASTAAATTAQNTVLEPLVTLAKSVVNITPPGAAPKAGDVLRYTLTITAANGALNSNAYDISIADTLSLGLLYQGNPTVTGGTNTIAAPTVVSGNGVTAPQVLNWSLANANANIDISKGTSVTVTYDVVVLNTALASQALSNTAIVQWTSLDGISTFERIGTGSPAYNDYFTAPATTTLTTPNTTAFAKTRLSDTYGAGDSNVRIGDTVDFELRLHLNEGTTASVVLNDNLPRGLQFESIVSVNGDTTANYDSVVPFTHASIAGVTVTGNALTGPTTVTWNIGNIVNAGDNISTNNDFVIVYRAKVLPDAGIPHVASSTLTNTATMTYTNAAGGASLGSSATITVLQPIIATLTKTEATHASGSPVNPVTDTLTFRLAACNTGQAPAYSVVLTDTLPTQFNNASIVAPSSAAKFEPDVTINGTLATSGVDYVYIAPPVNAGTFVVTLSQGVSAGQCVYVDYNVSFDSVGVNESWSNQVDLGYYWSLPATSGQRYNGLGPVLFGMNNLAPLTPPMKVLQSSTGAVSGELVVGDELVYRITLPTTSVAATLINVKVSDVMNPALTFVSATKVSGDSAVLNVGPIFPPYTGTLNLGDVDSQIVFDLRARVDNNAAANAGVLIDNTVSYTYEISTAPGMPVNGGSVTTTGPEQQKIVEPLLALVKTVTNVTNPGVAPKGGDVLRYTLAMAASSGANFSHAYDISIVDTLSLGLSYSGNPTVNGGNTIAAPVVSGNGVSAPQVLNWNLANGSNIDITEGNTVTVTYDVVVLNSVLANQTLSNSAVVQWTSLNGVNANERDGSNSPVYNDYFSATSTTSLTTLDPTTLSKTRVTDTYGAGDSNVRIGDVVDFQLSLHLPEGTTSSVVLTDILPQGLQFESIVSVNGDSSAPFGNAAPFTHPSIASPTISGNPLTGPSTASWTIGNIVNAGDNNAVNDNFVIVYRARVLNGALAQGAGIAQALSNNATLNYTTATGAATRTSSASLNLQQPMLAVSKSATTAGGSTTIASGELVTYTVDIVNSGTAPAYDTVLHDVIPLGMRNGVATITMVSTALIPPVGAAIPLTSLAPVYIPSTGSATWNFDTGAADAYTIPAGYRLRVVYQVQADTGLSAGLSMTNQAQVQTYCSFDNNAIPSIAPVSGVRQCYGASNTASATLITAAANPLGKANTQAIASIGEQFRYRITVPATPQTTALYDVRILDNLAASAADMSYVGITQISGPAWTPVVTGMPKNLVISGSGTGIDIPAGQQLVFDVTVVLNDSAINVSGLAFQNTASYIYNQFDGNSATQVAAGAGVTAPMTIVGPDSVTLQKGGPATMRAGVSGTFTLNVQNTGSGPAWDMTIVDILPDPTPGGMCDVAPSAITARMFLADGVTPAGAVLVAGTDYSASFAAVPACTLTLTMNSAAAAIAATNRLIVSYQALIDADNFSGTVLTNIAAATQWFSADTPANVATGQTHTHTRTISDGTPGTLDHQDAHSITTEAPVLEFRKSVINVTTAQNPGANARPGDLLRYSITIRNVSPLSLSNFTLSDELDRLNALAMFVPGSLNLVSYPAGASATFTSSTGGSKGTGLVDIRNMSIDAQGGANETLTVVFEARLASVITNGAAVLNQAQLPSISATPLNSDDPNVNGPDVAATIGDEDPTRTVITSAPIFEVIKTSLDISGDPLVLMAGDRLRYTIAVKNIGNENASNVSLRDLLPANTTYVAGTTQLNGVAVPDVAGVSALQTGMLVNAPENLTAGVMRADASATVDNVATITFEVQINSTVLNGTIISNQGFVNGSGLGSGAFLEKLSDDPGTAAIDDPTLNIVGNFPLLIAQKIVAIQVDNNSNGIVDPLDVLRYTITISNLAAIPASGIIFTDLVPADTTYVADTVTLNGVPTGQPDAGVSPLISGIGVESPAGSPGTIAARGSAVITFDVQVNANTSTPPIAVLPAGTVISNQGQVSSVELPALLTDADGNSNNGYQPTTIIVGTAQQIVITKQVTVVGGGPALPGGQLEYLVSVRNTGTVAASNVVLTDDLSQIPLSSQVSYVANSATLNGVPVPGSVLTAAYGTLLPGSTAQLRFRVQINAGLPMGTTISNTGQVAWDTPTWTATATVSIDVGGIPGSSSLNGHVWHDANLNKLADVNELNLAGWTVSVYRSNVLLGSALTDANGLYSFIGLTPSATIADQYALKFSASGATANTAKLGRTDSIYTNGMQEIAAINALSGSNIQNLNLPIQPNGVVYNSILRTPVAGATLTMVSAGSAVPLQPACFEDPAQQGQVTLASGYYKFDLNFSDPSCPAPSGDYLVQLTSPLAYLNGQSLIIPPLTDGTTPAFSVPGCTAPAMIGTSTVTYCESQLSEFAPGVAVSANTAGTNYFLRMLLNNTVNPIGSQMFNNHIALDPRLDNAVTITKVSSLQNVTRGQIVPYTITVSNSLPVTLTNMNIRDAFPLGFKYVAGSGRLDGLPVEPVSTTRTLTWANLQLASNTKRVIQLMLIVGSGVAEGKYVNRAQVFNTITGGAASPEASATVRVIPDPTLDCSDVIGKVFDDANLNGYQDEGEMGLPGVRVVTARGLLVTADKFGRFHLTCAVVPDPDRGSNFILKVDDRTLPSGYRLTTENPRVQRATRGKMLKFNFGAAIHKVVKLDMADGVFEPGTTEMRVQWKQRIVLLLAELKKAASVLRLSYLAEAEDQSLVNERLNVVKREISQLWKQQKENYDLNIETEVFWRTGSPPEKRNVSE